jgi:prepilin-type N-terminal cleavage/methylation domain-containing protein
MKELGQRAAKKTARRKRARPRSVRRGERTSDKSGFTILELLVVVAIIGIIASIAIPQYANYKSGAADATAKSDLHNMATALEAYYSASGSYAGADLNTLKSFGFRQSSGVDDAIASANQTAYSLSANPSGGTDVWSFDSVTGQITAGS